ncbi:MAG: RNase III inhibitor [Ruminococcaceae bacterium]|nr:RNase III inhibitor [Oscillospiraceae bacterium]
MPFEIVRNDITNMKADAIVNAANPRPIIGYGVDSGIHKKAGSKLLEARKKIGDIEFGDAAATEGFGLDAKIIIHAVSPVWQGGRANEIQLLQSCYEKSLQIAVDNGCESIAFPLLSAGNHGFPKDICLETAIGVFSRFLLRHDMHIYLVVFGRNAFELSEKLMCSVKSYIDDNYIREKSIEEYGAADKRDVREAELVYLRRVMEQRSRSTKDIAQLVDEVDESFSQALIRLIDEKGLTDPYVYKKANIDRKLFSKIKNNRDYRPGKATCTAFAVALELDVKQTRELIGKAGYALTHSSKFDIIIEYFITSENYDIFEINEVLFAFGQPLLGG